MSAVHVDHRRPPGVARVTAAPPRSVRAAHGGPAIRSVRLRSVAKVSVVLYTIVVVLAFAVGIVLWTVGRRSGFTADVESLIGELFVLSDFRFRGDVVLTVSAACAATFVVLATALNVIVAALYNAVSAMVGGVEVKVADGSGDRVRDRAQAVDSATQRA